MNLFSGNLSDEATEAHANNHEILWLRVLEQAFIDATYDGTGRTAQRESDKAHNWISRCGPAFQEVCSLAGMDPDFLSNRYNAGQINRVLLKASEKKQRQAA